MHFGFAELPSSCSNHHHPLFSRQEEDLKTADGHLSQAYDLVWKLQAQHDEAVELLQQAFETQQAHLGKDHPQVGHALNFVASALWMQGSRRHTEQQQRKVHQALTHFGQARFIFCKCGSSTQVKNSKFRFSKSSKQVRAIDERIACVLIKLGLPKPAVDDYHVTLTAAMEHELMGD